MCENEVHIQCDMIEPTISVLNYYLVVEDDATEHRKDVLSSAIWRTVKSRGNEVIHNCTEIPNSV